MKEMTVFENRSICRICLREDDKGTNLFSSDNSKDILDKIFTCFQIILHFEEYLPYMICTVCCKELEYANNFRLKCTTFEERFTALYSEVLKGEDINQDCFNDIDNKYAGANESVAVEANNDEGIVDTIYHKSTNINKGFKCVICSKILKTHVSLLKHNVSMHQKKKHVGKMTGSGTNRRYHCTECPYSTPHSQTLVNHMRRHNGERPYLCKCGKSFTQAASLTAHKKTHSDTKCFTCSTCGKQFKHAFSLKNHFRVHEDGSFICDICQKCLKSAQSLRTHMNRHYNIRNYNCEDCGATFVSTSELLNHRQKHNQMMNAECHICGYKTHAKKNLIVHLKRHTGEKPFKCDLCSMATYTHGDLRRHQRVHSREKPYQCPVCTQRFSHSGTLNQHARKVHSLNYRWGESKTKEKEVPIVKQEKQ